MSLLGSEGGVGALSGKYNRENSECEGVVRTVQSVCRKLE